MGIRILRNYWKNALLSHQTLLLPPLERAEKQEMVWLRETTQDKQLFVLCIKSMHYNTCIVY
jgi:hypothetical protein